MSPGKLTRDAIVHAWTPSEPGATLRATGVRYFASRCGLVEAQATIHFFYVHATCCPACFPPRKPQRSLS
ncbi:MAG TPA: hypothetical protein VN903_14195 [Polyangia bacterium]|nr:hypothetical protein [Polyangia bacterium]